MTEPIVAGQMVFHDQLGLGKVIRVVPAEVHTIEVAFLWFWPLVTVRADGVKPFLPSNEFLASLKFIVGAQVKISEMSPKDSESKVDDYELVGSMFHKVD